MSRQKTDISLERKEREGRKERRKKGRGEEERKRVSSQEGEFSPCQLIIMVRWSAYFRRGNFTE